MKTGAPLQPGCYYHIYNRGNNREDLFREERNYRYFLQLYAHHVHAGRSHLCVLSAAQSFSPSGAGQRNPADLTGFRNL